MATTVVPKGAGRPAHAANRAKHAQRTPLPARGQRGTRSVTAKAIAEECEAQKATRAKKAPAPKPEPELSAGAVKSRGKAEEAASVARKHHYDVEIQTAGGFAKVIAIKTHKTPKVVERVEVAWIDGRMSTEDMPKVIITDGGKERTVLLRNASAFKMQVSGQPKKPVALVARQQRSRRSADEDDPEPTAPFDETATEVVLLDTFRGAKLHWRNGLGGNKLEHGTVSPKAKHGPAYRITDHPTKKVRILHFIDVETQQQRAVALNKITRVVK